MLLPIKKDRFMSRELHLVALSAIGNLPGTVRGTPAGVSPIGALVDSVVKLAKRAE